MNVMEDIVREKKADRRRENIWTWVLSAVLVGCVLIMLTLCADEGIDYDESYSFKSARDYTQVGIVQKMIDDFDTDVPLYYCILRVWIQLFGRIGHTFWAARIFSVVGAAASMLLGMTAVRKLWGNCTALFFMIAAGLAPAMLHVSVNIRMYSWTNFLVTASAVVAFCIVQNPHKRRLWVILGLCTLTALFSHYFTAFACLAIYLYLLTALFINERKQVWKVFALGVAALIPFFAWMIVSGFFHFIQTDAEDVEMKALGLRALVEYLFSVDMRFWLLAGVLPVMTALAGAVFFMKNDRKSEKGFVLMCTASIFVIYLLALALSSFASHFFIPRHIMHAAGMMWLGIAIALPRINRKVYLSGLAVLVGMCYVNYQEEYDSAYRDTPYLEATKAFIANEMEAGDIVIYSAPAMYSTLYSCYMPEQTFIHLSEVGDINELAGKRVWYFCTEWNVFFSDEDVEKYGITSENVGHYGFQIIDNCTDFDLLRLQIRGTK